MARGHGRLNRVTHIFPHRYLIAMSLVWRVSCYIQYTESVPMCANSKMSSPFSTNFTFRFVFPVLRNKRLWRQKCRLSYKTIQWDDLHFIQMDELRIEGQLVEVFQVNGGFFLFWQAKEMYHQKPRVKAPFRADAWWLDFNKMFPCKTSFLNIKTHLVRS